jgi:hypothetical protein
MTIDLTPIILAIVAGVFATLKLLIDAYAAKTIKDRQSAAVLDAAVSNALGAMQQEAQSFAATGSHTFTLDPPPGVSPTMAVGVQYVLDHAGDEAARFGITPPLIAGKLAARIGLANIESNIGTAASPASTVPPLAPITPLPQGSHP